MVLAGQTLDEERVMARMLSIIGVVLIAVGLLWVGQGTRVIPWPEVSPMIGVQVWAWRGLALALVGVVVLLYARRQRPWWRRWF